MKKNQEKHLADSKAATKDRAEIAAAATKDRDEKAARIEKSLGKIAGLQQKTLEGLEDVKTQNKSLLHKVDFIGQKLTKMEGMIDSGFASMATNFE